MTPDPRNDAALHAALLEVQVRMAEDPRDRARERVQRRVARFQSALGLAASLIALWDLSLLARIGH